MYVRKRAEPSVTTKFGTSAVNCFCACTVSRPSVIVEIPSVMINAFTRNNGGTLTWGVVRPRVRGHPPFF